MKLLKPSKELSSRVKSEVGFNERFTGYRLHKKMGAVSVDIYSIKELINLLNGPHPRIDFAALRIWLSDVIQDTELAGKIGEIINIGLSGHEKTSRAREAVEERFSQCNKGGIFKSLIQ